MHNSFLPAYSCSQAPTLAAPIDAEDVRIIDGDTIRIYQKQPNVRLVGFNAPETRRAACEAERELGDKATRRLRNLIREAPLDFDSSPAHALRGPKRLQPANTGGDVER